jgi:hypothetical protein
MCLLPHMFYSSLFAYAYSHTDVRVLCRVHRSHTQPAPASGQEDAARGRRQWRRQD